ncbi:MAG: SDR family NAD(P)-dependent oxidoreductase [Candidatus Methylacidiphilales bacterium]|nr:SDR family NAD(P)-dependent oxidoreductase [Candidatus Methylacidiphilales bacterium]
MRVLVTGGAGFIGSHVLQKLQAQGHETALMDEFNDFYDPAIKRANAALTGARQYAADIRQERDVNRVLEDFRPEALIHLAARAGVRPSLEEPQLYIDTNVTGTLNLLQGMKAHGIRRMVFGSSSSVYGCNTKVPFSEEDPISRTISPYAATKVAGEHLCTVFSHLYDLDIVALRFFTVYGPRQRPDLAIHKFTRAIWEGKSIDQFGDGSTRRDYTYVDDIVDGVTKALHHPVRGYDVFNLGESRTVELRELIRLIETALGRKAQICHKPEQPGDVPITFANIDKSRRVLGYDPHIQIEEGITRFVDWFKKTQTGPA